MNGFIRHFKRRLISSSFFWRTRHLIQPKFIDDYENKDTSSIQKSISSVKHLNSILDFGCATGKLLYNVKKTKPEISVIGIDINAVMLQECNKKFRLNFHEKNNFLFLKELDHKKITDFLFANQLKNLDICVFDRVLYCLELSFIKKTFNRISEISEHILIDDFFLSHNSLQEKKYNGYLHRDWIGLLSDFGFKPLQNIKTPYKKVDGADARRLIFRKN